MINGRCGTCAHWDTGYAYVRIYPWNTKPEQVDRRFGLCQCPGIEKNCHFGGARDLANIPDDGAMVEYDEDWGMLTGREFGCVHHQEKP